MTFPAIRASLLALLLSSCHLVPPKQGEWTYVGLEEANLEKTIKECRQRADEEFNQSADQSNTFDPKVDPYSSDPTVGAISAVSDLFGSIFRANNHFNACMNGRGFAKEPDVERLKREIQDSAEAKATYAEKQVRPAKKEIIEVGDYVTPRFSMLVLYRGKSTASGRVATASSNSKVKVLRIEDDWIQVELNGDVGWVRSGSISASASRN